MTAITVTDIEESIAAMRQQVFGRFVPPELAYNKCLAVVSHNFSKGLRHAIRTGKKLDRRRTIFLDPFNQNEVTYQLSELPASYLEFMLLQPLDVTADQCRSLPPDAVPVLTQLLGATLWERGYVSYSSGKIQFTVMHSPIQDGTPQTLSRHYRVTAKGSDLIASAMPAPLPGTISLADMAIKMRTGFSGQPAIAVIFHNDAKGYCCNSGADRKISFLRIHGSLDTKFVKTLSDNRASKDSLPYFTVLFINPDGKITFSQMTGSGLPRAAVKHKTSLIFAKEAFDFLRRIEKPAPPAARVAASPFVPAP